MKVLAFDPAYGADSRGHATDGLCLAPSALDCIQKSDVVVVATSWPEFNGIAAAKWTRPANEKPRTVIDCWRSLHFLRNLPGVHYLGLGMGEGFA